MGIIRESCDPEMKFPSSWYFGSDLPLNADILVDDFTKHVLIKRKNPHQPDAFLVDIIKFDDFLKGRTLKG